MSNKRRGLGRGLDALLSDVQEVAGTPRAGEELRMVPVERLERGRYQPRKDIRPEALTELAASIRSQGIIQPLIARPIPGGRYEIVAGERRWRAAQLSGLDEVPVVVRDIPDKAVLAVALIENIQREDLNPLEEAEALARLAQEFELTHAQAAAAVGRSRTAVTNLLRLMELEPETRRLLREGHLGMGHARALLTLTPRQQAEAAQLIVRRGLSARESEALARRLKSPASARKKAPADPNVVALERELTERLGARVTVKTSGKGRGSLVIYFSSLEELDGILARLH